jgi:hypothetical protein
VSRASESRAETVKLARVLGVEELQELAFLLRVPAPELRDYREAVTDLLYDRDRELLQRTADAARLLPARTAASIAERALGPLVCARLTGLLDPRRAAEISDHFTVDFMARLAAELDPRRAAEVVSRIATDTVVAVSTVMAANGEHVAMGRFVAYLDESALGGCVEVLGDEDLLRVAFVMEGEERLAPVFQIIGGERTARMLASAQTSGLVEEAEHLVERLEATGEGRETLAAYSRRSTSASPRPPRQRRLRKRKKGESD